MGVAGCVSITLWVVATADSVKDALLASVTETSTAVRHLGVGVAKRAVKVGLLGRQRVVLHLDVDKLAGRLLVNVGLGRAQPKRGCRSHILNRQESTQTIDILGEKVEIVLIRPSTDVVHKAIIQHVAKITGITITLTIL